MSTTERKMNPGFERYLRERMARAGAITPGQKKKLIEQLRRELAEEGRVPLSTGPVKVDTNHAIVRAALEGRAVSMGGTVISNQTEGSRIESLSVPVKIAILILIFVLPLLIVGAIINRYAEQTEVANATASATASATSTITPTSTNTPKPTTTETLPTETPIPTASPVIIEVTPTPYAFALTEGDAPPTPNDPASIEIAGFSYILGVGKVKNGIWSPAGAEWLTGSELRRVVGLPYEPTLAQVLAQVRAGLVIKLRLRSGEVVKYKIAEILRVQRQQIEVLAEKRPSLAVVLYGEPSPERTVLIANAVQEQGDFTIYSIGDDNNPIIQPVPEPTLIPTNLSTIITDTRTITNTLANLTLLVADCQEADQIGGQKPADKKQKYLVCDVTLTANPNEIGSFYTQEAFFITDLAEIENTIDWLPPPIPAVSEALGNGYLTAGDSKDGRIAGLIESSQPVLVWQQGGRRIIIKLE